MVPKERPRSEAECPGLNVDAQGAGPTVEVLHHGAPRAMAVSRQGRIVMCIADDTDVSGGEVLQHRKRQSRCAAVAGIVLTEDPLGDDHRSVRGEVSEGDRICAGSKPRSEAGTNRMG